jgi:OOP family OmpA-OmpF porin
MNNFGQRTVALLSLLAALAFAANASALEILTKEDIQQKIIDREDFVKTADNFIVMFDASRSMAAPFMKGDSRSKYDMAKEILRAGAERLPDLGFYGGLYLFAPSVKEVHPVVYYQEDAFVKALESLPAKPEGPTLLAQGLQMVEKTLSGMAGRTAVFIFTDGNHSGTAGLQPEDYTARMAQRYDVCFYIISSASDPQAKERVDDMAKANVSSRVISFNQFVQNPNYVTGALYVVRHGIDVVTTVEKKMVGVRAETVLFEHDKTDIQPVFEKGLNGLGDFLVKHPDAYAVLAGYTDNTGSKEYNFDISMRRAQSVADYLMSNFKLARNRLVLFWYGTYNPVASNTDEKGRALNRRVEIAVGGM